MIQDQNTGLYVPPTRYNFDTAYFAEGHAHGISRREEFALRIFCTLARNGIYSEGEAVRYADLLIRALITTKPHDPTKPDDQQ